MPRDTTKAIAAAARSGNINLTNWGLTEVRPRGGRTSRARGVLLTRSACTRQIRSQPPRFHSTR